MWTKWTKPFQISKALGNSSYMNFCVINVNRVNKTLSNIKSSWEQFLTKQLFDHCEQSEQNPLTYQKLLGTLLNYTFVWSMWTKWTKLFQIPKALGNSSWLNFCVINVNKVNKIISNMKSSWELFLTEFLCDQCEQIEQNPFKYQKLLGTVLD